ncbi:UDP-glycosyltransferase 91C1 [Telopea speciosissima]|uniref:UDP-glycosyltransferase 91C1 n=1 Tax=Telopea speciosissima TaxID=54955 RepID=UPI001CC5F262|nr:UDP-glycosyltransferase 91C1 [Telopea speciosissima]
MSNLKEVQARPSMDNNNTVLHITMLPWLAMGHLIPFLELSKCLALKGHRITLISTPRNIKRLSNLSPNLSPLITLIELPLPHVHGLPENAESSMDIHTNKSQHLKMAFDGLEAPIAAFLERSTPDWIIYDYASHWLPTIATRLGVPCAFFGLFTAAFLAFIGPPSVVLSNEATWSTAEDFTVAPSWVPFPSNIVFRLHEVKHALPENISGFSDSYRFGIALRDCEIVLVRSRVEFEPEWFKLLTEFWQKPVIPVGFLPPSVEDGADEKDWAEVNAWLDKHRTKSVVYVALGTEAKLSQDQVNELALGLELSGLPFFWVLRELPGSTKDGNDMGMLPDGFEDRTRDRGLVFKGWAPQVRILGHSAIGGILTHCGWNSVIEALSLGRALILLPVMHDQGLNARLLEEKKIGLEIPRDERDGSFTRDSVADTVRLVMVEKEGEPLRSKAKEARVVLGNRDENEHCFDGFVRFLMEHKRQQG